MTIAAAETLARLNPAMTFVYVSGAGTDGNEQGRLMWTRVKSRTENALLALFPSAYMFRPGFIEPVNGERSKTAIYNFFMRAGRPVFAVLRRFPKFATTTEKLGRAMLAVAKRGYEKRALESVDINRV
jgi:uncharacterized protein YbjT (DUF2867 family)